MFRKSLFCLGLALCGSLAAHIPAQAQLSYQASWLGNTWGRGDGRWVQNNVVDLWVKPDDGTCYTISGWDEGKHEGAFYRDGDYAGNLLNLHTTGEGGDSQQAAITGDDGFVYVGLQTKIRRYNFSGSHAAFTGGTGSWSNEIALSGTNNYVISLAADAANDRLFASDQGDGEIEVYSTTNGLSFVQKWPLARAGRCAVAPDGSLWVAQQPDAANGIAAKIVHFSATGTLLSQQITGGAGFDPDGLAFKGGALYVADNGPDQNIKIYSTLTTSRTSPDSTFGTQGGVFAGTRGATGALRFVGLTGVGFDSAGKIYVAQNRFGPDVNGSQGAGTILECYSGNTRQWRLLGLEFMDGGDFDPQSDGQDVFSKYTRYSLDLTKSGGQEWTYAAHTLDHFSFPTDQRFANRNNIHNASHAAFVRRIGGKKFLFNTSMLASRLEIYRFDNTNWGEIAIPCGFVSLGGGGIPNAPTNGQYIWRDLDGDGAPEAGEFAQPTTASSYSNTKGWWVDSNGDLWQCRFYNTPQIRRFAFQGLTAQGVPQWDFANVQSWPVPAPFAGATNSTMRLEYFPATDTLYLAGYTTDQTPPNAFNQKYLGKVLARYDGWLGGNRTPKWSLVFPDYSAGPTSMRVAGSGGGEMIFVGYDYAQRVDVYRASDSAFIGQLTPIAPVSTPVGRIDVSYGVSAFKRANNEYLVLVEEDWWAKQLLYRWQAPTTAPASVQLEARPSNTVVRLRWNTPAQASAYIVERATSASGPWTILSDKVMTSSFLDTNLSNGTRYFYRVTARGAAGDAPPSLVASALPLGSYPLRINVGGGDVDGASGSLFWLREIYDENYGSGSTASTTANINTANAANSAPLAVYQSRREGKQTFTLPGQASTALYTVRLHFVEPNSGLVAWREFDGLLNGTQILDEYRIGADAGAANVAVVKEWTNIAPDANGAIALTLQNGQSSSEKIPVLQGIEFIPQGAAVGLAPIADAFVRDGTFASTNYGLDSTLVTKMDAAGYTRWSYLKFDTAAFVGSVGSAKLRLYGAATAGTVNVAVYGQQIVSTGDWGETTLTWNNKPASLTTALSSQSVSNTNGVWEWDATPFLQSERSAGRTTVGLVIKNTTNPSPFPVCNFNSREADLNAPQLVLSAP